MTCTLTLLSLFLVCVTLANSLAMIAIAGMVVQEGITGGKLF